MPLKPVMPDVAQESSKTLYAPLNWVGMSDISLPVLLQQEGHITTIPALIDAQVSLDLSSSRGIHMSRLYSLAQDYFAKNNLSTQGLVAVTAAFLESHKDLSSSSRIRVRLDLPVQRKALKSGHISWRNYPVSLRVENHQGQVQVLLEVEVAYSSTCPASAALSRQLIQEKFKENFGRQNISFEEIHSWLGSTEGIVATPHAQRSFAKVGVEIKNDTSFGFLDLIDLVEEALQTPVQTLVKREDEQEFALRNGQNLMFCEDAARRIQDEIQKTNRVQDYWIYVNHQESLHPHNAVSYLSKTPESSLKSSW